MRPATPLLLALLAFAALSLNGCATGLTALSVAGYAKTAYDYQDVILPESRVSYSQSASSDKDVENRLMQRFEREGLLRAAVVEPHAIGGHVYLVGAFADKNQAEHARAIAKATPGVNRLTCSFLLMDPAHARTEASEEAERSIRSRLPELVQADTVRVSVLDDNAMLMGSVPSGDDKRELETLAWNTAGVGEVRSYLTVRR
ncbi:MAG: BON domain-containing protein [Desulfovibrionaceae bacterium]